MVDEFDAHRGGSKLPADKQIFSSESAGRPAPTPFPWVTSLPTGTVTFLFTDIEGSTPLWERAPAAMEAALEVHNGVLQSAITAQGGVVFKFVGDEFSAAFPTAPQALAAAIEAQRGLLTAPWNELGALRVRMGIHTGEAHLDNIGDEYAVSHTKNRASRVMSAGHGGQILLSQESADLCERALPEGVHLKDLGQHRLKGLSRLEHLYQVVAPGLREDFPPLRTLETHPYNLPLQLTSFIGREAEILQVKERLAEGRLVTLTGSGGVGKSRLSIRVAEDLMEDYPDGIWYVELASLTDPALVIFQVANTLGLREEANIPFQETLIFFLRSRQILLILDNCEHLLEACSRLVDLLLHACPRLKVLVSSREPLGVGGEAIFRLPSLPAPDPNQMVSLESLGEYAAVRLFIERTRLVLPDYKVTPQNAASLARICQRMDGIPLALELAASRMSLLTADQLVIRLDDAFRLLTGGSRTALPRHQTLQATIDWSHSLLSSEERCLLRRLSVFAGGCTLEAAEEVCAGDCLEKSQVLELLGALVNKSMLISDRRQEHEPRYRLYETVRQYAQNKLFEAEESQSLRDRHLDYFLNLAEMAEIKLHSIEQPIWIRRVKAELDNLRAAMAWACQGADRQASGLRIAISLSWTWHLLGNEGEGKRWIEVGLELLGDHPEPSLVLARAKAELGYMLDFLGDFPKSQLELEQCIDLCQALGESAGVILSHALNGFVYNRMFSGDVSSLQALIEESIHIARGLGPAGYYSLAMALDLKMWFYMDWLELYDEGKCAAEEFLNVIRQSGDTWNRMDLWGTGFISTQRGNFEQARTILEEALSIYTEADNRDGIRVTHLYLGWLSYCQGNCRMAYRHHLEQLRYYYEVGNRRESLLALAMLGVYKAKQSLQLDPVEKNRSLEQAAILFGAYEKLNEQTHYKPYPFSLKACDQAIETLRSELDLSALSRSWVKGAVMTLDEAVAFAFSLSEPETLDL